MGFPRAACKATTPRPTKPGCRDKNLQPPIPKRKPTPNPTRLKPSEPSALNPKPETPTRNPKSPNLEPPCRASQEESESATKALGMLDAGLQVGGSFWVCCVRGAWGWEWARLRCSGLSGVQLFGVRTLRMFWGLWFATWFERTARRGAAESPAACSWSLKAEPMTNVFWWSKRIPSALSPQPGLDRSGKSTQSKKIATHLEKA